MTPMAQSPRAQSPSERQQFHFANTAGSSINMCISLCSTCCCFAEASACCPYSRSSKHLWNWNCISFIWRWGWTEPEMLMGSIKQRDRVQRREMKRTSWRKYNKREMTPHNKDGRSAFNLLTCDSNAPLCSTWLIMSLHSGLCTFITWFVEKGTRLLYFCPPQPHHCLWAFSLSRHLFYLGRWTGPESK